MGSLDSASLTSNTIKSSSSGVCIDTCLIDRERLVTLTDSSNHLVAILSVKLILLLFLLEISTEALVLASLVRGSAEWSILRSPMFSRQYLSFTFRLAKVNSLNSINLCSSQNVSDSKIITSVFYRCATDC